MIKAVLFDVGGTLITPQPSVGAVYAEVARRHGVEAGAEELNERFKRAWQDNKKHRKAVDKAWWRRVVTDVVKPYTFLDFERFFDDLYDTFRQPKVWRIHPQAVPTLSALKNKKLLLAVASNWDDRLPHLLTDLGLALYFSLQFISCSVGFIKPDPRFFKYILNALKLRPEEVIHVGDDPEEDIAAAKKCGIRTAGLAEILNTVSKTSA